MELVQLGDFFVKGNDSIRFLGSFFAKCQVLLPHGAPNPSLHWTLIVPSPPERALRRGPNGLNGNGAEGFTVFYTLGKAKYMEAMRNSYHYNTAILKRPCIEYLLYLRLPGISQM